MKVRIGEFTIDFNEETIRRVRKESYVKTVVRRLGWTGIESEVLTEKVGEVYDAVKK